MDTQVQHHASYALPHNWHVVTSWLGRHSKAKEYHKVRTCVALSCCCVACCSSLRRLYLSCSALCSSCRDALPCCSEILVASELSSFSCVGGGHQHRVPA